MTVDAASDPWWQHPAGRPPSLTSERAARSTLAAGFLITFLLGSTGIAAAKRQADQEDAMRRFCASYRSMTSLESIRNFRPGDIDSAETQAVIQLGLRPYELARSTGNPRVVKAFAEVERDLALAGSPGTTPAEVQQRAERTVGVLLTSFQTTLAECREAGFPIED